LPDEAGRVTFGWLARSALLVLWALVAWGGLLLVASITNAVREGLRPALVRLLPSHWASAWGWLNALSAGLALAAALGAAGLWVWGRVSAAASKSGHLEE
jgi:hypothetical protein